MLKSTEAKLKHVQETLDLALTRETNSASETKQIFERCLSLEKEKATLELELKAAATKYEQESKTLRELRDSRANNHQGTKETTTQLVNSLQDERMKRQQAESLAQEKERQLSMMNVDYRQIQQRAQKLEAENRHNSEKVRTLTKQAENDTEKRIKLTADFQALGTENASLRTREKQTLRDIESLRDSKATLEREIVKMRSKKSEEDAQAKELHDAYETEQQFATLYKTQVKELQEEIDEKTSEILDLAEAKSSLNQQLQSTLQRLDAESAAKTSAHETIAELEKDRTVKELEYTDTLAKFNQEINNKDSVISTLQEKEAEFSDVIESYKSRCDEVNNKLKLAESEKEQALAEKKEESEKLNKQLKSEQLLKMQAVNKLAEIMARKENMPARGKPVSSDLKKKEKEARKLQQELTMEREKFSHLETKRQKEIQDLQAALYEETQAKLRLQMESDSKVS